MTPQEAVNQVVANDIVHAARVQSLVTLRGLFDACVTTTKAEATKAETLRCADRVKEYCFCEDCRNLADDLLITGELEVDG